MTEKRKGNGMCSSDVIRGIPRAWADEAEALAFLEETGLSYKSALFLLHRVRYALCDMAGCKLTRGVELDETYVGGKPLRGGDGSSLGRGTNTKKYRRNGLLALDGKIGNPPLKIKTPDIGFFMPLFRAMERDRLVRKEPEKEAWSQGGTPQG